MGPYAHNLSGEELTALSSPEAVAPGGRTLGFRFARTGDNEGDGDQEPVAAPAC